MLKLPSGRSECTVRGSNFRAGHRKSVGRSIQLDKVLLLNFIILQKLHCDTCITVIAFVHVYNTCMYT